MRTGRVVVVTGAAGGMGRLIVRRFLDNGDTVVATDKVAEGLADLRKPGIRLDTVVADITREDECAAVAAAARGIGGRVDVLVNVAGHFPVRPFDEMTADEFRAVVDINLTGAFLIIKAMAPLLRGRGWGRIILVGSASTFEGVPGQVHYVAAKAGLFGLSRSLARVFGKEGITVNVVTPGLTLTRPVLGGIPQDLIGQQAGLRALPRDEQAADLVGAIFFLASPDADFVSGQTINVDDGKHML